MTDTCTWEKGKWPVEKGDEIDSALFEDIRKRLWLLTHQNAGHIDLVRKYGKYIDDPPGAGYSTEWTYDNWVGSWEGFTPESPADPGQIMVLFKDGDIEDLFINYSEMDCDELDDHPPLNETTGMLDSNWRLYPNPNLYCHYNRNAGRAEIGAAGRWDIRHHSRTEPECEPPLLPYNCKAEAYKFLPQHTPPNLQIPPVKIEETLEDRRSPVEVAAEFITKDLTTQYERSFGDDECIYPERLTEYIKEGGEPENTSDQEWQYAAEAKMCKAYQDRVLAAIEYATEFLKQVNEDWIAVWSWNMSKNAPNWDNVTTWYEEQIVKHEGIYYIAIVTNTGHEPPNIDYWLTPVYQPGCFRNQPVYYPPYDNTMDGLADGATPYWVCNGSSYELALKNIIPGDESIPYDWYWDSDYPFIPPWLHFDNQADPDNNPLPRGCWRRTWRHSMGRVSTMMWPGDAGLPPGYGSDLIEASKFIITQTEYDAITDEDKKKNYRVVDVEGLYDAAYGEEEEALIAERHDSIAIHKYKTWQAEPPEWVWHEQPLYEIYHDLVNDLRNALIQLYIIDQAGIVIDTYTRDKQAYREPGATPQYDTEAEAYTAGKSACDSSDDEDTLIIRIGEATGKMWMDIGYIGKCKNPCEVTPFKASGCTAYCQGASGYGTERETFLLRIMKANELDLNLAEAIVKIGYKGQDTPCTPCDGCEVGFDDLTVTAAPGDSEKCAYVRLILNSGSGYWQYYAGYGWYYICDYVASLISDWPSNPKPASEFHRRLTRIDASGWDMDKFCVFEIAWCDVPASIFEEDPTNYIVPA